MPITGQYLYRSSVAAILQRHDGCILIAERMTEAGAWQFPQGGVDKGETREQAVVREVEEEISLRPFDYQLLTSRGPYRYLFANGRKKRGFDGQEQHYFLARLTAPESAINVVTPHQEFRRTRWIKPSEFDFSWLPSFKRDVYRAVMFDFFGITR